MHTRRRGTKTTTTTTRLDRLQVDCVKLRNLCQILPPTKRSPTRFTESSWRAAATRFSMMMEQSEETDPLATAQTAVNWLDLLKQTRGADESKNGQSSEIDSTIYPLLPTLKDLLIKYNNFLENYEASSKEDKKVLFLNVRAALRLALYWSSTADNDIRDEILSEVVVKLAWHKDIFRLLASEKGDTKCRVLASQLLSNLVTSNPETARTISSSIPLSPSDDSVMQRMRDQLTASKHNPEPKGPKYRLNWVDIILSNVSSKNREALAGTVAGLHNCVVSLQREEADSENQVSQFAHQAAQDRILVSLLLRHVIPANAIMAHRNEEEVDTNSEKCDVNQVSHDSATEWITLLLVKFCKLGLLPDLMLSLCERQTDQLETSELTVVPEQIVLLQCIQSEVEMMGSKDDSILGGESGTGGLISTHAYLARLYCSLRSGLDLDSQDLQLRGNPDYSLKFSAVVSTIDIIACSLGQDSSSTSLVRTNLGSKESAVIRGACNDLGMLIDSMSRRNVGRKNRDFIVHDEEKRFMTSLVRLLGNICFRCKANQDLVRLTAVPSRIQMVSASREEERNGLHVVLSCTSLSHACFTLREWAVIAIRNLLDSNELNQAVVAELEANQPIQSAELESLGIRVDLDSKGNVSVAPAQEKE